MEGVAFVDFVVEQLVHALHADEVAPALTDELSFHCYQFVCATEPDTAYAVPLIAHSEHASP